VIAMEVAMDGAMVMAGMEVIGHGSDGGDW